MIYLPMIKLDLSPHSPLRTLCLPFLGGLLYAQGFPSPLSPPFFLFPILGLLLFFQALPLPASKISTWKINIVSTLCFCLGIFLLGYYWIPHTLKEFGDVPFPLNIVLGILFSPIIAPQYFLLIPCLHIARKHLEKIPSSSQNLLLAILITLLEHYTPQQFPAHPGHGWGSLAPYLALAPIFGVPLFSLMSTWCALSILKGIQKKGWDKMAFISLALFLIINFSFPLPSPKTEGQKTTIRIVQPNIGHFMKRSGRQGKVQTINSIFQSYSELSLNPSTPIDLIVWPETAYPLLMSSSIMRDDPDSVPTLLRDIISQSQAQFITGGYDQARVSPDSYKSDYNTLFYFDRNARLKDVYHKRRLIPFGEALPFGPLNPWMSKIIKNISFFAEGTRFPLFILDNGVPFINAICYEILFNDFMRSYLNFTYKKHQKNAQWIINASNDSWYGDTSEPYQHQYLSHWRALEFQIPIVRTTNTGITSILYPDGSQSKTIDLFQAKNQDYHLVTAPQKPTPFQKYGILLTIFLALLLFSITLILPKNF